jgi:hypothetical protein
MQERNSVSINSNDTSVSKSTQLDYAVPASKISPLSSGTFVGMVADNPDEKIELKVFTSEIQNDHAVIKAEEADCQSVPVIDQVTAEDIQENYLMVKADIQSPILAEISILKERKVAETIEETVKAESKDVNNTETTGPAMSM